MKRSQRVACAGLAVLSLTACRPAGPKATVGESTADAGIDARLAAKREEEFRWKERCAVAAERLDKLFAPHASSNVIDNTSVSEVFYSSTRNSCICESATQGKNGKYGITTMFTLWDCLTREDLGETLIRLGDADSDQRLEHWKQKKAALK